jgi:large subunit ribosomal protein L10
MNRQEKTELIESLKQSFNDSNALFWINCQGLSVGQLQALRVGLREQSGSLKVAKVRIVKRAVQDMTEDMHDLLPQLKEQLGIVFSTGEPNAVAKVLYDFSKKNEALEIVVGHFERKVMNKDEIKFLATLPSREVLLSQLCGTLNAPISNFTSLMHLMIVRLLVVLKKVSEVKS